MDAFTNLQSLKLAWRAGRFFQACVLFVAALFLSSCGAPQAIPPTDSPTLAPATGPTSPPSTDSPTLAPTAAPTSSLPPTGWIAYDSKRDGYWGIYVIPADGSGQPMPITAHLNGEYDSTWDPGGKRIAFESLRNSSDAEGTRAIYIINTDGTQLTQLTDNTASDMMPSWSPDGEMIAFVSDRASNIDIYTVRPDGTGLKQITDDPAKDQWVSWSPDGAQIAFVSDRSGAPQIFLMRADGTGLAQLTRDPGTGTYPYFGISLSQENELLVEQLVEGGPGDLAGLQPGDLLQAADGIPLPQPDPLRKLARTHKAGDEISLTVLRDGKEIPILLKLGAAPQVNAYPAWSPAGQDIAFASRRDGDWDIYIMAADGSGQRAITDNDADDLYPTWSPDGQYIAFSSDQEGNMDVYVMRADGSNITRLTDHPTDEYPPRWAPAQAVVSTGPSFGPPFCLRDANKDGQADMATTEFSQADESLFIGFPYANIDPAPRWSVQLLMENADSQIFSGSLGERPSGLALLQFPNMVAYSFTHGSIHGSAIGAYPPGVLRVQILVEDKVLQEIECQVVEP